LGFSCFFFLLAGLPVVRLVVIEARGALTPEEDAEDSCKRYDDGKDLQYDPDEISRRVRCTWARCQGCRDENS
jgi:phage baseplate assembly protein gpV